ncbi:MAG TPA: hypothetical protein VI299_29980 [Polyangiales bacterium]
MTGADGGTVAPEDDAGSATFSQVTVQVANYVGQGLALGIDGLQRLPVQADGTWKVQLSQPASTIHLVVTQQPMDPDQLCSITQVDANVFTVRCDDESWAVSGTVHGYAGKGLQLALYDEAQADPTAVLDVGADGAFAFPNRLPDATNYEVRVLSQPTGPRQTCVVDNARGFADFANVENVAVTCTTNTYLFTSVVTGLKGKGLKLKTDSGDVAIDASGTTTYASTPYPDGFHYNIEIAQQPTNPDQRCYIEGGQGTIDGANVTYTVVCGAANTIMISEVGACPYASSACWFEVVNQGNQPENLGFYTLRTSALSSSGFSLSKVFALPTYLVPPSGRAVIQAKLAGSLSDGHGVFHIRDGDAVPWWGADGFIELLDPDGLTADFMRFGDNAVQPTTGGSWAGGSAPALPRGPGAYGRSLQHARVATSVPSAPSDFTLRAFATYAGANDVVGDVDADNDGIPDANEVPGGTFSGLSLYAMGARPNQRDVFVEVDHMAGADPATLPRKAALDRVVEAFRRRNIAVHFDVGDLFAPSFDPANYNLGGGNEVPFSAGVGFAPNDSAITDLYDIKAEHMEAARRMVFYYQLFGWSQQADGSGGSSGIGEMPGNDTIITLGGFGLQVNTNLQRNLVANYQAATIMHELGHNFGLRHGGRDSINRKPNYVSVMNYLYSPLGLPTIGNAESDRYDFYKHCRLFSVTQLTNAPSGDVAKFVIDFSSGNGLDIDEHDVLESEGLGRADSEPVDFNCNSTTDAKPYARDLNADGSLDVLEDTDDWSSLDFVFRRYGSGAENGPSLLFDSMAHEDVLTADTEHHTDEPCPGISVPTDLAQ